MRAAIGQHELALTAIQPGHSFLTIWLFLSANPAGLREVAIRNIASHRQYGGGARKIASFNEQVTDGFIRQDDIFHGIKVAPHFHGLFIEWRTHGVTRR